MTDTVELPDEVEEAIEEAKEANPNQPADRNPDKAGRGWGKPGEDAAPGERGQKKGQNK